MKIPRWTTVPILATATGLALSIGVAPSHAEQPGEVVKGGTTLRASDISKLPLTNRHLSNQEKANLAVVLRAYQAAEGSKLDVPGFVNSFAKDGVFNDAVGGGTYRGEALGDVPKFMASVLPDVHRELKQITVHGDVISIELSIRGTFTGSLPTPAGIRKGNGATVDVPTADFWYLRHGKVKKFNCFLGYSAWYQQMGVNWDWDTAVKNN